MSKKRTLLQNIDVQLFTQQVAVSNSTEPSLMISVAKLGSNYVQHMITKVNLPRNMCNSFHKIVPEFQQCKRNVLS